MTNLQTLKPANLTPNQAQAAARFSAQHGNMTVSQAAKWLNYIFALKRGEITLERFQQATGHDGTPFTKYIENDPSARAHWRALKEKYAAMLNEENR